MTGPGHAFTVTLVADVAVPARRAALARALAAAGATAGAVTTRSAAAPEVLAVAVEVAAGGEPARARARALRRHLLAALGDGVDVAVVPAALAAPGPRLLVADMDSTLITIEVIDELARHHGVGEEVAAITARAMQGELDFEASLRARVARLAGLDAAVLDRLAAELPLTPGATTLVRGLHRDGGFAAVVSGGFTFATTALAARLGLDHAHANTLEIVAGRLTGGLVEPVVTPARKAELVDELAAHHGLAAGRVIAVGDGANDLLMFERAGLGVAFHAKPRVAAAADTALGGGGLERVLYLLGWTGEALAALAAG
ncbi:MAG: phosphoserine phosphatase SerB [Myxococcales bacterium]|nr:phosphoserine phosphatase SerB [Myxococcales bacterium]